MEGSALTANVAPFCMPVKELKRLKTSQLCLRTPAITLNAGESSAPTAGKFGKVYILLYQCYIDTMSRKSRINDPQISLWK